MEIDSLKDTLLYPSPVSDTVLSIKRDYLKILADARKKMSSNKVDTFFIKSIIPVSEEEYLEFYNLSNDANSKDIFTKLDELFYKLSTNEGIFIGYLNMAEFVDGEYAESYFDGIDYLLYDNKKRFCEVLPRLSKGSLLRLDEYKELCHKEDLHFSRLEKPRHRRGFSI